METMQTGGAVGKIEAVETPKNGPCLRLTLRDDAGGTAILSRPPAEMAEFLRQLVSAGDTEARDLGAAPSRLDVMGRTIGELPNGAAFSACMLAAAAAETATEVGEFEFSKADGAWTASLDVRITFAKLAPYVEHHFPGLVGTND